MFSNQKHSRNHTFRRVSEMSVSPRRDAHFQAAHSKPPPGSHFSRAAGLVRAEANTQLHGGNANTQAAHVLRTLKHQPVRPPQPLWPPHSGWWWCLACQRPAAHLLPPALGVRQSAACVKSRMVVAARACACVRRCAVLDAMHVCYYLFKGTPPPKTLASGS